MSPKIRFNFSRNKHKRTFQDICLRTLFYTGLLGDCICLDKNSFNWVMLSWASNCCCWWSILFFSPSICICNCVHSGFHGPYFTTHPSERIIAVQQLEGKGFQFSSKGKSFIQSASSFWLNASTKCWTAEHSWGILSPDMLQSLQRNEYLQLTLEPLSFKLSASQQRSLM